MKIQILLYNLKSNIFEILEQIYGIKQNNLCLSLDLIGFSIINLNK